MIENLTLEVSRLRQSVQDGEIARHRPGRQQRMSAAGASVVTSPTHSSTAQVVSHGKAHSRIRFG